MLLEISYIFGNVSISDNIGITDADTLLDDSSIVLVQATIATLLNSLGPESKKAILREMYEMARLPENNREKRAIIKKDNDTNQEEDPHDSVDIPNARMEAIAFIDDDGEAKVIIAPDCLYSPVHSVIGALTLFEQMLENHVVEQYAENFTTEIMDATMKNEDDMRTIL